ncbi:hypothetical protein A3C60_02220 [Candidatus Nomurabacteria bacterium RIFCSPHIGHO2_02_FULL_37_45]|uniref:Uncharacterized protein n=1 Tax=Candidatus Nomurabacteria bacterium RIFCSPHIGHO2_12_FULL_37_29 TaxID=1801759 RepID=A0A1F6WB93_9BACT|nr:MAG: hypothetical protein A2727_00350 [Candidatus Nomurabacteria bacterium RIFCSPHIGHO2_01_FULL_37_110]OGI70896.1 MAG: hypothetical protein A3C60_02220 [Candidatus Nomurabacteria bacterium RIFCSPHIGHO2_02_FULL_37_45]OGI79180.1 MAG: hypothetical protein A3F19_00195 [Candidatus Nomurabacteria bacterium RIFCSPHIGHO2_12_FULL_37_29]OGI84500.1 MAG: hypothetical protein A3A92_01840 [Candidatus Nomurabacteria bacterium RIFCSPLOWO2_01_FULL_37_49]
MENKNNVVVSCLGHVCLKCKKFWKHEPSQPFIGFACSNELTMMFCPSCLGGGGGGGGSEKKIKKAA